ncbi:hypothetical protein GJ234_07635 [Campylobacter jejuni]|nr:hypothetical protein [Campylobacter jejuni]
MSDYKIYNCDCIEFMKDMVNQGKKVDCIITDPPYLYLNHKLDRQFSEELFFEIAERRLKSTQDTLKQNLFYGMDI